MATYRVDFLYTRTVSIHLEAESADEIHEFLEDNPEWGPLADGEDMIDSDESELDDYEVADGFGVTADFVLLGGEIVEAEDA